MQWVKIVNEGPAAHTGLNEGWDSQAYEVTRKVVPVRFFYKYSLPHI